MPGKMPRPPRGRVLTDRVFSAFLSQKPHGVCRFRPFQGLGMVGMNPLYRYYSMSYRMYALIQSSVEGVWSGDKGSGCSEGSRRSECGGGAVGKWFSAPSAIGVLKGVGMSIGHRHGLGMLSLVLFFLAGCGSPEVYEREFVEAESPFKINLAVTADQGCEAARRALLSEGYVVERGGKQDVFGRKQFQPDEKTNVMLEFHVVCAAIVSGSTLFANAVQTRYSLKKSRQSTSVSVPSVGSLSVPWGETTEEQVRTGSETVVDEEFYARFFKLVRDYVQWLYQPQPPKP